MTNQILKSFGFYGGRMICASKSEYRKENPDNLVVFNSTLMTKSGDHIIMVDLDLTLEDDKLKASAKEIGEFIVLRESDAWNVTINDYEQLKEKAVKIYV